MSKAAALCIRTKGYDIGGSNNAKCKIVCKFRDRQYFSHIDLDEIIIFNVTSYLWRMKRDTR